VTVSDCWHRYFNSKLDCWLLQAKYNAALFKSVRSRRLDNGKVLLERLGAERECWDEQGRTPFIVACGHHEAFAWYLMDVAESDVAAVDNDGLTALHWAACAGWSGKNNWWQYF